MRVQLFKNGVWWVDKDGWRVLCSNFGGYFTVPESVNKIELVISKRKMQESILVKYEDFTSYLPEYDKYITIMSKLEQLINHSNRYIRIEYES